MRLHTRTPTARCPHCQQAARKIHSRYRRTLADLPWEGIAVMLQLSARKFFCHNEACPQRIFCERVPELAAPHARRTLRLCEVLAVIGFALGGRPGARAAAKLSVRASARTLLRRVRATPQTEIRAVRVLGVDDFAFRKGQRYGTMLVDQERRRVIDLLADREAATLEQWLKAHPGIEIITRDRAPAYAEGAANGAPLAQQIADRFHLLKHLAEALERCLCRHQRALKEAAGENRPDQACPTPVSLAQTPALLPWRQRLEQERQQRRERRHGIYAEVIGLYRQGAGMGVRAIARRLGLSRQTVRKYVRADAFPEIGQGARRTTKIDPFRPDLKQRWAEGCYNATQLWREISGQGFEGTASIVRWHLRSWRAALPPHLRHRRDGYQERKNSVPSPRQAVWRLLKRPDELEPEERGFVERLIRRQPEIAAAQKLAQEFQRLVRERRADEFDDWRAAVSESGLAELKNFAAGLMKDEAAVRAALCAEWSNGRTEGHINRLKMIKRQMFGRSNLDLLKLRVLHAP